MKREPRVPDPLLEQLALGELLPEQARAVRQRLAQEPGGVERLAALELSNEQILTAYPPGLVVAEIKRRKAADRPAASAPRRLWLMIPAMVATAATIALVAWPAWRGALQGPPQKGPVFSQEETTRIKGDPLLMVYRKSDRAVEQLQNGAIIGAGDLLQISYTAGCAKHGVIFSVDSRGTVTLHFPLSAGRSTALVAGKAQALPYSYELDDTPGGERFFFITSDKPINVQAVLAAGRTLAASAKRKLSLPAGLRQKELALKKNSRDNVPR